MGRFELFVQKRITTLAEKVCFKRVINMWYSKAKIPEPGRMEYYIKGCLSWALKDVLAFELDSNVALWLLVDYTGVYGTKG